MTEGSERNMTRRDLLAALGAAAGVGMASGAQPAGQTRPAPRGLDAIADVLPRTASVLRNAAAQGGAGQFYLSRDGKVLADVAWGTTREGAAYTPATLVSWASAVKPTTCTCLMKLWERGRIDIDDTVTKFIPEFGVNGKADVTIRHLLTHTAHLGGYGGPQDLPPRFEDSINAIVKAPASRTLARAAGRCRRSGLAPDTTRPASGSSRRSAGVCTTSRRRTSCARKSTSSAGCQTRGAACHSRGTAGTKRTGVSRRTISIPKRTS